MTHNTTFDKIEAWLSGELSEAEARAFEAEIAADDALAAEVERHRRGREALDRLAEQSLQADFARWRDALDDIPPPPDADVLVVENQTIKKPVWPRWLGIAALLLALAGVIWMLIPETDPAPHKDGKEETAPPPPTSDKPIAEDAPPAKPDDKVQKPPVIRKKPQPDFIAMANARMGNLRGSILQQYGQTMGDEEEENPLFTAGLKAFKSNDTATAKQNLLQIPAEDDYFPSAQEMLAAVYFQEKNFGAAARCYEHFARQSTDPAADWRLVQFYLADYDNRKTDFWKKMDEILNPAHPHRYRGEAKILKKELSELGISNK